jgi:hypothetical protein
LALRARIRPHFSPGYIADLGQPIAGVFTASAAPTTVAGHLALDGFLAGTNPSGAFDLTASWAMNPNAKLWVDRGSSPATANAFGVSFRQPEVCTAALNGFLLVDCYIEYDVEWRTAL